jgi:integrase
MRKVRNVRCKGEYVFCRDNGEPYDCRKKLMAGIYKKAEIKRFSFHSLRHFGAIKLIESGVPLTVAQAIIQTFRKIISLRYRSEIY